MDKSGSCEALDNPIVYKASRVLSQFHHSSNFVRTIIGPIGSGKSVACCIEMFIRSMNQEPNKSGTRKTRWVVVRNTYRELTDTTIQTFFDWIPESLGIYRKMENKFTIDAPHPSDDGTTCHIEFLFRALDKPNDVKKLLSLEMTGMWINEAREIPKQILDMGIGRLGRYPNSRDGGPTWHGLIMDTNPPDSDHWYYNLFEENLPHNHAIFHQPSGTSDSAENVDNLPPDYYENMQAGKDQEWINVYVHGKYGFIADGKPVYPEYNDDTHYEVSTIGYKKPTVLAHTDGSVNSALSSLSIPTIYIGIDFGLTPAAVFGILTPSGCMELFDELVTEDMGAVNFGKLLYQKICNQYPLHAKDPSLLEIYADPAGEQRSQSDETTPFQMLSKQKIDAYPTYTNDPIVRREVVADFLQRLDFSGSPALQIGPGAPMLRKSFAGGYKYKRMAVSGESRYQDVPDKGRYSHVADACQYLFLGAVGGDLVMGGYGKQALDYNQIDQTII